MIDAFWYLKVTSSVINETMISMSKLCEDLHNERQRRNFKMFIEILRYSYRYNSQFIHIKEDFSNRNALDLLLKITDIGDTGTSLKV